MSKAVFIIAALSIVLYANSIGGGFISDDIPTIVNNPPAEGILECRSFGRLLNVISYKLGGLNPLFYHLHNIIFHTLNSILVFFFLSIFFKPQASFLGALLFASHPIHTEVVAWISGVSYLYITAFLLSSFLLYHLSTKSDFRKGLYLASLFLFAASLFNGWYGVCFPGLIILYDFTYKKIKKNWKLHLPFILLSLYRVIDQIYIAGGMTRRVTVLKADLGSEALSNPLYNLAFSFFSHLKLLLWPVKLTLYHEPLSISLKVLWLEIFMLLVILSFLPLLFKKAKPLFLALGIFLLFLSPTYSFIPIAWLVAERYLYLPSISFSILGAFILERYAPSGKKRLLAIILIILLLSAYSLRTILRNGDWKDRASLWRATVKASPLSHKAHNNMGDIYGGEGNLVMAEESFRRAIELKPDYAHAYHNLANTQLDLGKVEEAILNYQKAISLDSELYQSYQNLGVIYFNKRELEKARECLNRALEIAPGDITLRENLKAIENINIEENPQRRGEP